LLQSKDYKQLLDVIDFLRFQNISRYIRLLQLIVCDNQLFEKSSVFKAVSEVRFFTKKNLCIPFATELIFRRNSTTNATVAIISDAKKSDKKKKKFLDFRASTVFIDNFLFLIDDVKKIIDFESSVRIFSDNVLRVEISKSEQSYLIFVDFSDLIYVESRYQFEKNVKLIFFFVRFYIANIRNIILAVVSARNNYVNQIVIKLARDVDSKDIRTLDIIIKSDTLRVKSKSEKVFSNLAENKDIVFRLG